MTLEARAAEAIRTLCPEGAVAVACSGGGDSIATLHLAVRALGAARVTALSVNHNLRPEAADEMPTIEPVYPLTAGLSPKALRRAIEGALQRIPKVR